MPMLANTYASCLAFSYSAKITALIESLVSVFSGCTISLYAPSGVCLDGIAMKLPLLPEIILTS